MNVSIEREHPVPANPNCVSFATEAGNVLAGQSWADVLRLAAEVAEPFYTASGLPILVGMGWRVALTRKNRRHAQVTLYFLFDGPATAAHLDTLEEAVAAQGIPFGSGSIERVPANGVPMVLFVDGEAHLLWSKDSDGTVWTRRLELTDGVVSPLRVEAVEATAEEVAAELPGTHGVAAPYGDEEREVERMRLAFARHFSWKIIEADGVVREGEKEFMANVFPPDLIRRLGLTDDAVQAEYVEASKEGLPGLIGHHDKLGLIGLFFSACYSDGSLDAREMRVLKDAGEWLGLTKEEVVKYLRRFW